MAISYFSNFPSTNYFGLNIPNITLRVAFYQKLQQNSSIFYPYTVKDGERADAIAYWYYGDSAFDWLVYFSNNIIDPYTQWPKTLNQFDNFITLKYGSVEQAQSEIVFYRKNPTTSYVSYDNTDVSKVQGPGYSLVLSNTDIRITPESYAAIDDEIDYFPVYAYDYETELNDAKKNIVLIDSTLKHDILSQLKSLMNG